MATVTLSVSEELKKIMDKHPETKWSEIFRRMIFSKVEQLKRLEGSKS